MDDERKRQIEEEEAYRAKVRQDIENKQSKGKRRGRGGGCLRMIIVILVALFGIVIIVNTIASRNPSNPPPSSSAPPPPPPIDPDGTFDFDTFLYPGVDQASGLFPGMQPFRTYVIEKFQNPNDSLNSPMRNVTSESIDPGGAGYELYFIEGTDPGILYQDVCPAGYETTWYSFTASGDTPIAIYFEMEVEPQAGDNAAWFGPLYREDRPTDGENTATFTPPVHVGFCSFSDSRGAFRRSHSLMTRNEGAFNVQTQRDVACRMVVNNSGNRVVLGEDSGGETIFCFGEREPQ